MSERQSFFVFLVAALVLLAAMALQVRRSGGGTALGHAFRVVTAPVVEGVSGAGGSVLDAWRGYAELRGVRAERDRLRARVRALEAERVAWQEALRENERLRAQLGLRQAVDPARGVVARVVSDLSAGPLQRAILIDKGRSSGIGPGWVAIQGGALVGRVVDATPGSAKVLLIVDPDSGVAVRHQADRFNGVLRGGNRGSSRLARLEYVPRDQAVAVGDTLVSSGLDGLYPPGVLVGHIREISGESPLTWKIAVQVAAEPALLEELLLVPPAGTPAAGAEAGP